MDQILSGMIAANVTLIQPWYSGAVGLILAAFIGAIAAGGATLIRDIYNNGQLKRQRRHGAYGQLMGRKSTLLQSYASYNSAIIRSEMLDCRSILEALLHRLDGMDSIEVENIRMHSIEFTDGMRAKNRAEDLQLQIAKSKERFWMTISQIEILFSPTIDLIDKISQIKESESILACFERDIIKRSRDFQESIFDDARSHQQFMTPLVKATNARWAQTRQNDLMASFDLFGEKLREDSEDLGSKIDELLDYLKIEIMGDTTNSRCYRICRFFCNP